MHMDTGWRLGTVAEQPVDDESDRIIGPGTWDMKVSSAVVLTPTCYANGLVYVGNANGYVFGFYIVVSAVEAWRAATGAAITGAPTVANGVVYVASQDFNLYAYDLNGGGQRRVSPPERPDPRALRPDPALLPFWNVRATRGAGESAPQQSISPMGLVDQLLAERDQMESAAELELLRLWFAPEPPRPVLEKALRAAGFAQAQPLPVRAVVYLGEIADRGPLRDSGAAHELPTQQRGDEHAAHQGQQHQAAVGGRRALHVLLELRQRRRRVGPVEAADRHDRVAAGPGRIPRA